MAISDKVRVSAGAQGRDGMDTEEGWWLDFGGEEEVGDW